MKTLFLIPARGGSKGVPGKNIKPLHGKPLIHYSIDVARKFVSDDLICVSSDDKDIITTAEKYGLKVPFVRPAHLADDRAGSYEVIMHALEHYSGIENVVLLQPTSPFRMVVHVKQCLQLFTKDIDAVYSVKETRSNPFYLLYIRNKEGFLEKLIDGAKHERRQDAPEVFEINGAVYVLNTASLLKGHMKDFKRVKYCVMPEINSVDIDTPMDWEWAEFLLHKNKIQLDHGT